jgi:hypothetical protein
MQKVIQSITLICYFERFLSLIGEIKEIKEQATYQSANLLAGPFSHTTISHFEAPLAEFAPIIVLF